MPNPADSGHYQPWNLAEANIAIDEFFAFLEYTIPECERKFLRKIQQLIECTEMSNTLLGALTKETQEEMFKEALEKYKSRAMITYHNVEHIIYLLEERLQNIRDHKHQDFISHADEYLLFLEELKKCAQAVFDVVHERFFSGDTHVTSAEKFYSSQNPIYKHALLLGGIFKPMSQFRDPLIGKGSNSQGFVKFKGACYGHAVKYAVGNSVISLDTTTHRTHVNQNVRNQNKKVIFYRHLNSNIYPALDDLLSQIYSHHQFHINLDFDGLGHVLKIQKVPDKDIFILFDSNFGEFIFTRESCKAFLAYLIGERYTGVNTSAIFLYDEGEQFFNLDGKKLTQNQFQKDQFALQYVQDFLADSWKKYSDALEDGEAQTILTLKKIERRFTFAFNTIVKEVKDPDVLQAMDELWQNSSLNKVLIPQNQQKLKALVCQDIEAQLKQFNRNSKDAGLLRNFKRWVEKAPGILTLASVVERWKEAHEMNGRSIPYLASLSERMEISPYRMALRETYAECTVHLRQSVVDKWQQFLGSRSWARGMPRTLGKIKKLLHDHQSGRCPDFFYLVKDLCQRSHANFIVRILKGRSKALNDFYKEIGAFDLAQPDSYVQMMKLIDQLARQYLPSIVPSQQRFFEYKEIAPKVSEFAPLSEFIKNTGYFCAK